VLIQNIFCYCLGPSLLALIPIAGPPLALVFIFIAWCVSGAKRLYVSWRGAIIASSVAMLVALVVVGLGGYVANMVLHTALGLGEPEHVRLEREQDEQRKKLAPPGGGTGKVQP
jgi:hypothetical protein